MNISLKVLFFIKFGKGKRSPLALTSITSIFLPLLCNGRIYHGLVFCLVYLALQISQDWRNLPLATAAQQPQDATFTRITPTPAALPRHSF
ncbi:MAG: hypothetical protein WAX67_09205 [Rugosibacter sp.]